jgi:hypothetical protein
MLKLATAVTAALALAAPAAARAGFKEPVKVIWQHTGAEGYYFGWAVSPLKDVDRDGVTDAIIAEPGNNAPGGDSGTTWIYSGRTGAALSRFDGKPGDQSAYAIADVGDLNRDGVHDVLSGAPRQFGDTEGHAYLISGRSGALLHTFAGEVSGDSFGSAVSSAGDVDRDGRPDLLIGAGTHPGGGLASVYSGRSFRLLYRIAPPDATHTFGFGFGTSTTGDVNRDRVPDLVIGGGGAAFVFSGRDGRMLYALPPSSSPRQFGTYFVAGVGDVNHDHVPDVYGADYAARDNGLSSGFAGVYSGRDGTLLHAWTGAAGDGLGPGRGAGDMNRDHRPDLAIGSYLNSDGAANAGKIELFSGRTGAKLRTITSTTKGENLGFDAVGVGDVDRDRRIDLLASAAEGDTVYMIAGTGRRGPRW